MKRALLLVMLSWWGSGMAQTFTDGAIQLQLRLKNVWVGFGETDATILGPGFAPDELMMKVWAKDNQNLSGLNWQGGTYHTFQMGSGIAPMPGPTPPINELLFNYTYSSDTVPQFFSLKVEAWEDDLPSDSLLGYCNAGSLMAYDTSRCCGNPIFGICVGLQEGDDKRYISDSFALQVPYRIGQPNVWLDLGYIQGSCGNDWKIGIEANWRYLDSTHVWNGIEAARKRDAIRIAPNPATTTLTLQTENNRPAETHFLLFDITGRKVLQQEITDRTTRIDVSTLSKGMYLYNVVRIKKKSVREKW